MEPKDLLTNIQRLRSEAATKEAQATASLNTLRTWIVEGGTTGDTIQDFVIVGFDGGLPEETQVERYRTINSFLKGKEGQVVIGAFEQQVPGMHRFGTGTEYHMETRRVIGLLASEELLFVRKESRMECQLPLRSYACQTEGYSQIHEGALSESVFGFFDVKGAVLPSSRYGRTRSLQLTIGDAEANEYLKHGFACGLPNKEALPGLLERLGRLQFEPSPPD